MRSLYSRLKSDTLAPLGLLNNILQGVVRKGTDLLKYLGLRSEIWMSCSNDRINIFSFLYGNIDVAIFLKLLDEVIVEEFPWKSVVILILLLMKWLNVHILIRRLNALDTYLFTFIGLMHNDHGWTTFFFFIIHCISPFPTLTIFMRSIWGFIMLWRAGLLSVTILMSSFKTTFFEWHFLRLNLCGWFISRFIMSCWLVIFLMLGLLIPHLLSHLIDCMLLEIKLLASGAFYDGGRYLLFIRDILVLGSIYQVWLRWN